jgi:flagellar FliL protein
MSAAAPPATEGAPAPVKKGKKKLIVIIAAALVLLLTVGGGAAIYLKKKAAAHDEQASDDAAPGAEHKPAKPDLKHPPTFLPLDPFVVNLADKDADRYAQIGITLEVEDAHFAEELKAFMPAIRNGILMILAHKSSQDLLDRAGKEELAGEILREASRTMGIDVEEPEASADKPVADKDAAGEKTADADKGAADDEAKPKAKKAPARKKSAEEPNPIRHVHFSNFIIQ